MCIEEGFIARSLNYDSERLGIGFRFPELPDVLFAVETISTDEAAEDDTLAYALREGRRANGGDFRRINFLRRRDRGIGQWQGEEALMRVPPKDENVESHAFIFKTAGVGNDMLRPYAEINFYTGVKGNSGGEVPPSLTDAEAIALWDRLTSTLRARPVSGK